MRIELETAEIKALAAAVAVEVNQALVARVDALEAALLKALGRPGGQVVNLDNAVIDSAEVTALLGIHRSTLWRMERDGSFPTRVQLTPGRIGWRRAEVLAWIAEHKVA